MRHASLLALSFLACAHAPYVVLHQGALAPTCLVQLDAVDFQGLQVGQTSEQQWQARKGSESQSSWDDDKVTFNRNFGDTLLASGAPFIAAGPASYSLHPRVVFYEPGFYAFAAARDTQVVMQLALVDNTTHAEVDLVEAQAWVGASLANPSTGGRFHSAAKWLGARFGQYVRDRFATCRR